MHMCIYMYVCIYIYDMYIYICSYRNIANTRNGKIMPS